MICGMQGKELLKSAAIGLGAGIASGVVVAGMTYGATQYITPSEADQLEWIGNCADKLGAEEQRGDLPQECDDFERSFILTASGAYILPSSEEFTEARLPRITTDEENDRVVRGTTLLLGALGFVVAGGAVTADSYRASKRRQSGDQDDSFSDDEPEETLDEVLQRFHEDPQW